MPIRDNTPVCINTLYPYGPYIALLSQELVIHYVKVNQAPCQRTHHQKKNTHHGAVPPGSKPGSQSLAP
jgi:hypothetical protein